MVYRFWVTALSASLGILLVTATNADAQSSRSAVSCDNQARYYSQKSSKQGQLLGGAAKGSLIGLGIGAIAGGAGVGAAIGAGVGLITGGAKRNTTADRMYSAAYQDCMAGR